MKTKIIIDLDTILTRIYAESARRAIAFADAPTLCSDQSALLEQYIESGFRDLVLRMGGYVALSSFTPAADENHIVLHLRLRHITGDEVTALLHKAIVELLAHYALMRVYGEADTWYGTAWRCNRSQVLLVLARDQVSITSLTSNE